MKLMTKILVLLMALTVCSRAQMNIYRGKLQTALNANGQSITNVLSITDPNGNPITGSGGGVSNAVPTNAIVPSITAGTIYVPTNYATPANLTTVSNQTQAAIGNLTTVSNQVQTVTGNLTTVSNQTQAAINNISSVSNNVTPGATTAAGNVVNNPLSVTNSTLVQVRRGTNIFSFSSFTNYYNSGSQAGDILSIHGTNYAMGFSPGITLPPNVTITGDSTNNTFLYFDTNGIIATNGLSLNNFTVISTNVNPSGTIATAPVCLIGLASNLTLNGMQFSATNGGVDLAFQSGNFQNVSLSAQNCIFAGSLISIYFNSGPNTGTVSIVNCGGYYVYPTNTMPLVWAMLELNGTGLSNTIINFQGVANYNGCTNSPEAICYFGVGSQTYINNLTTYVQNTNNTPFRLYEPILFESAGGIQVGPQQPSSSFVAYNLGASAPNSYPSNDTAGDWTKLGVDELYLLTNGGPVTIVSNSSFSIPYNNTVVSWCSTVAASANYNDFLNHIYGYPYAANWNFTSFPQSGGTNNVVLTNSTYGYSIQISAANGMFLTNIGGGPTALCLSNNGDKFICTNLGLAPNTIQVNAAAVAAGAYNGNNAKTFISVYGPSSALTTNIFSTTGAYAPVAFFESYSPNINFFSLTAPNTTQLAITNIWLAYAPPGKRGKAFTVGINNMVQSGRTNVNLVGATAQTIAFPAAMPSTNYVVNLTDNGGMIPGLAITTYTTTNFVTSMTALTFTGNMTWSVIQMSTGAGGP